MSCCPEFEERRARLKQLLAVPPGEAQAGALWEYLRATTPALRRARCSVGDERSLVMPAVLQLLLSHSVDEGTKSRLHAWLETATA